MYKVGHSSIFQLETFLIRGGMHCVFLETHIGCASSWRCEWILNGSGCECGSDGFVDNKYHTARLTLKAEKWANLTLFRFVTKIPSRAQCLEK